MLPPGPAEELFRVVVWVVIGIPMAILLLSVLSPIIVAAITLVAIQVGVFLALIGYIIGIPWSIWFRIRHGRWPNP